MTLDPQRVAEARLSLRLQTPPAVTLPNAPPDLDALYKGQGFAWNSPFLDCRAWAMQVETRALPPLLVALLEPLRENPTADDVNSAAECAERYELDDGLSTDVQWACVQIARRLRFVGAFMGHYVCTCMAYHAVSVTASGQHDDAILFLMLTTAAVLREVGHLQVADVYDPAKDADIAKLRAMIGPDMERDAGVVEFWRELRLTDAQAAAGADELRGAVRDDTGLDPRDEDFDHDRANRVVADLLNEGRPAAAEEPGITVLRSVAHLPGSARDGQKNSSGSTPRSEFSGIAGERLRCLPLRDLSETRAALVARHPHAARQIDRILGNAVGRPFAKLPPTLLVGPPGAGKTRLATDILTCMGLPSIVYACAGVADASFAGTSRQWGTGRGCVPIQEAKRHRLATCGIVLDEAEKCGESRHNGNLQDALLAMLDHGDRYFDPYVESVVDLSGFTFLATANGRAGLTAALLDRFVVIDVPTPGREHVPALVDGILVDVRRERGLNFDWCPELDGEELAAVQQAWRPGSIRSLRRLVEAILATRETLAPRH
ncbi:AAA family ATPase [Methylobacterium sp. C33D]